MKIISISDLHIKDADDASAILLIQLLRSKEIKSATHIVLLGDVFDLFVGNKNQYLRKMTKILSEIKKAAINKKLIYISGNHDFSIGKILSKEFKDIDFLYSEVPVILKDQNLKIYLSHGDEVDEEDLSYQKWKGIYSNRKFQLLIDYLLPYAFIDWLGNRASKASRKRGKKSFDYDKAYKKYDYQVQRFIEKKRADFYILGHTHIEYCKEQTVNNGFFQKHKSYAVYEDGKLILKKIIS